MGLKLNFVFSICWFCLFIKTIPIMMFYQVILFFRIRFDLNFLIFICSFFIYIALKLIIYEGMYFELTDIVLWFYIFFVLFYFSSIEFSEKKILSTLCFLTYFQFFTGVLDIISKHKLGVGLVAHFPNLSFINHRSISEIEILGFQTYRMQGVMSESSYFSVISCSLLVIFLKFFKGQYFPKILLSVIIFYSYSMVGMVAILSYIIVTIFSSSLKNRLLIYSSLAVGMIILMFEKSFLLQIFLKFSGYHISGSGRYDKINQSINLILQKPFFGYLPGYFVSQNGSQPGSTLLTMIIEFGLVGSFALLILLYTYYKKFFSIKYLDILLVQLIILSLTNVNYNPAFYLILIISNFLIKDLHKEELACCVK